MKDKQNQDGSPLDRMKKIYIEMGRRDHWKPGMTNGGDCRSSLLRRIREQDPHWYYKDPEIG